LAEIGQTMIPLRVLSFLSVALVFSAGLVRAQSQSDVDLIAGWSTSAKSAHGLTLSGDAAKLLGLSAGADVDCRGVAYENEKLSIFFCPIPSRPERLMVRKDNVFEVYWLIKNGELGTTVFRDSAGAYQDKKKDKLYLLGNDTYRDGYDKLLKFFQEKAKAGDD
jgi:hypothetical protein